MLPFVPYNPSQQLPNCSAPQQNSGNGSNMMSNFMQPGFISPQSSIPFGSPNFNGGSGNAVNPSSGFMGVPNQAPQNGYMGVPNQAPQNGYMGVPNQAPQNGYMGVPNQAPQNGYMGVPNQAPQNGYMGLPNQAPQNGYMGVPNQAPQNGYMGVQNQAPQNGYVGQSLSGSAPIPRPLQSPMTSMNGSFGGAGQNINTLNTIQPQGQQFGYNALNVPNQHSGFQNGQLSCQNTMQNMDQLVNLPLGTAQVAALTQILGNGGPVAQALMAQSASLLANQQLGMLQHLVSSANGPQHLPVSAQQLQGNLPASTASGSPVPQQNQDKSLQGNLGKDNRMNSFTQKKQRRNFKKDLKRDSSESRFQNSLNYKARNLKQKHTFNNQNGGSGNDKVENTDNPAQQTKGGKRRSLAMVYTEEEIQQWRNERRKHFPTKVNVEKKTSDRRTNSEFIASDAKLRRQQLKDILAKQAELGFEVPEIPPQYLSDSEVQVDQRHRKKRPFEKRDRFQNRNGKRGKFTRNERFTNKRDSSSFKNHNRLAKKQNAAADGRLETPINKREPTLLQKLLDPDIKREKRHLLQAFRFMVANSFFKEWPAKPLKYPDVIVNASEVVDDVVDEKSTSLEEASSETGNKNEEVDADDNADANATGEQIKEEGEIVD